MAPMHDELLNPTQQRVVELLGTKSGEAPEPVAEGMADDLRYELERQLATVMRVMPDDQGPLWVSKHDLSAVHGCEVRFLAEQAEKFAWTVAMARGTVAHKAIELSLTWKGEVTPLDLVEEAVARIEAQDTSMGEFLQRASDADLAELRAEANERVAAFLELFPPLKREWKPVMEARLRTDLCDDRVTLTGKVDLTLGQPKGLVPRKVLVDFKTGSMALAHRDDLRYYALLETLRVGVPPRRIATVYLDSGRIDAEDVTEGLLAATVRRVHDGAARLAELARVPLDAVHRPGRVCNWCPVLDDCEVGQRWQEENPSD